MYENLESDEKRRAGGLGFARDVFRTAKNQLRGKSSLANVISRARDEKRRRIVLK